VKALYKYNKDILDNTDLHVDKFHCKVCKREWYPHKYGFTDDDIWHVVGNEDGI
jgi:hypothetical protein